MFKNVLVLVKLTKHCKAFRASFEIIENARIICLLFTKCAFKFQLPLNIHLLKNVLILVRLTKNFNVFDTLYGLKPFTDANKNKLKIKSVITFANFKIIKSALTFIRKETNT